jgi:hypothetical protein
MKYLKRIEIDDAVEAGKASIKDHPGGGTRWRRYEEDPHDGGKMSPMKQRVMTSSSSRWTPLAQIAINAGKDDVAMIVAKVQEGKVNAGYDAVADEVITTTCSRRALSILPRCHTWRSTLSHGGYASHD